jgi:hypothetical protein
MRDTTKGKPLAAVLWNEWRKRESGTNFLIHPIVMTNKWNTEGELLENAKCVFFYNSEYGFTNVSGSRLFHHLLVNVCVDKRTKKSH